MVTGRIVLTIEIWPRMSSARSTPSEIGLLGPGEVAGQDRRPVVPSGPRRTVFGLSWEVTMTPLVGSTQIVRSLL